MTDTFDLNRKPDTATPPKAMAAIGMMHEVRARESALPATRKNPLHRHLPPKTSKKPSTKHTPRRRRRFLLI